jgi:hypothetical protein
MVSQWLSPRCCSPSFVSHVVSRKWGPQLVSRNLGPGRAVPKWAFPKCGPPSVLFPRMVLLGWSAKDSPPKVVPQGGSTRAVSRRCIPLGFPKWVFVNGVHQTGPSMRSPRLSPGVGPRMGVVHVMSPDGCPQLSVPIEVPQRDI